MEDYAYVGQSVRKQLLNNHASLCGLVSRIVDVFKLNDDGTTAGRVKAVEDWLTTKSTEAKDAPHA